MQGVTDYGVHGDKRQQQRNKDAETVPDGRRREDVFAHYAPGDLVQRYAAAAEGYEGDNSQITGNTTDAFVSEMHARFQLLPDHGPVQAEMDTDQNEHHIRERNVKLMYCQVSCQR